MLPCIERYDGISILSGVHSRCIYKRITYKCGTILQVNLAKN